MTPRDAGQWDEDESGRMSESETTTGHWAWKHCHEDGSVDYVELTGDVRFHDVSFGYVERQNLHDIELFAEPGQKLAFVGATGGGNDDDQPDQSVLRCAEGSITYDGIDVKLIRRG